MLSSDIRNTFLKFFERHGHKIVDSSSVIPHADPSLLFTNAGMVQFKNIFTGLEKRDYKRATTSQKCIRAGGKHNDLDQVGFTARHHTFFEMLGNFSFGDYFKDDAIYFAWELLTKEFNLPKEKLLVTVYYTDEEAKAIWRKVAGNITIIPIDTSDNFWSMGDVGPCGPCTEIFFDHGPEIFGGMPGTKDENGDRYVEIWNIVFMQYEQRKNADRIVLEKQSIDTGMGLERITSVLQGVHDNYQTDLFKNIIEDIKSISHTNYELTYPSYKVIADHIRSISFLIADGVMPSNEGRGYVLRRILRRAMRHGNMLGLKEPFLFNLSGSFIDSMPSYPELEKARTTIATVIHNEEEKFLTTLDRGLKILRNDVKNISGGGILEGDIAFKLYDTYGFPLDLTADILKADNISIDVNRFNVLLQEQKNKAKWSGSGAEKENEIWFRLKDSLRTIPQFIGYDSESAVSDVLAIIQNGSEVKTLDSGEAFIITAITPFYAESGGQCGDSGVIKTQNGGVFKVLNTLKFADSVIAHRGEIIEGNIRISDHVNLKIDSSRRGKIKANHTATHLLQAALMRVLGEYVVQRGSFHDDSRLRFDFSHNSALSAKELSAVEQLVNDWILKGENVVCKVLEKKEAMSLGAIALFGEKYGDYVRTVHISDTLQNNENISFELCGGTHVSCTSEVGIFKIISEVSVGSGIRRIEAITGPAVLGYLSHLEQDMKQLSMKLKCSVDEVTGKIDDILKELKLKNQEISVIRQNNAVSVAQKITKSDVSVITIVVENYRTDELRAICEIIKAKNNSQSVIIVASGDKISNKINVLVAVSADLRQKYNAATLLKFGLAQINGKGGGNAEFAQGGGTQISEINNVICCIIAAI